MLWLIPVTGVYRFEIAGIWQRPLLERETKAERQQAASLSQFTTTPPIVAVLPTVSGCRGLGWDFTGMEPQCPTHCPTGLVP